MAEPTEIIVVLTRDGVVGAYVQNGTTTAGQAAVEALFAALGAQLPFATQTEVEFHRANPDQVEERPHTHQFGGHEHGH